MRNDGREAPETEAEGRRPTGEPERRRRAGPDRPPDRGVRIDDLREHPRARTHGGTVVARELRELRAHALDPASAVAAAFRDVRADLVSSLAGEDSLSAQERWLVDEAAWTRLLLMHVNTWLAQQPTLINARTRELLPIIRQKQGLVVSLQRLLDALGLKRRARDVGTLHEYLAGRAATADAPASDSHP